MSSTKAATTTGSQHPASPYEIIKLDVRASHVGEAFDIKCGAGKAVRFQLTQRGKPFVSLVDKSDKPRSESKIATQLFLRPDDSTKEPRLLRAFGPRRSAPHSGVQLDVGTYHISTNGPSKKPGCVEGRTREFVLSADPAAPGECFAVMRLS